jgi:hypothetical protein
VLLQVEEALADSPEALGGCYPALPPAAGAALGHLMHASLLRGAGKGSKCAMYLARAEEIIDAGLAAAGVEWGAGEAALRPPARVDARLLLSLRLLVAEQRALAALVATDLAGAARHAAEVLAAVKRFPGVLAAHAAAAHMLAGHYAQAVGSHGAAAAHFGATLRAGPPRARKMAALAMASAELAREGGGDLASVGAALEAHGLDTNPASLQALPSHERALAQLLHGALLQRQGDPTAARIQLTKALKVAHGLVGSTQLVGQVLTALAPVQYERQDLAGSLQMFDSAITLIKSIGDLPSMVATLRSVGGVHRASGDASESLQAARRGRALHAARCDATPPHPRP